MPKPKPRRRPLLEKHDYLLLFIHALAGETAALASRPEIASLGTDALIVALPRGCPSPSRALQGEYRAVARKLRQARLTAVMSSLRRIVRTEQVLEKGREPLDLHPDVVWVLRGLVK